MNNEDWVSPFGRSCRHWFVTVILALLAAFFVLWLHLEFVPHGGKPAEIHTIDTQKQPPAKK
jgi:hypothetical protein